MSGPTGCIGGRLTRVGTLCVGNTPVTDQTNSFWQPATHQSFTWCDCLWQGMVLKVKTGVPKLAAPAQWNTSAWLYSLVFPATADGYRLPTDGNCENSVGHTSKGCIHQPAKHDNGSDGYICESVGLEGAKQSEGLSQALCLEEVHPSYWYLYKLEIQGKTKSCYRSKTSNCLAACNTVLQSPDHNLLSSLLSKETRATVATRHYTWETTLREETRSKTTTFTQDTSLKIWGWLCGNTEKKMKKPCQTSSLTIKTWQMC